MLGGRVAIVTGAGCSAASSIASDARNGSAKAVVARARASGSSAASRVSRPDRRRGRRAAGTGMLRGELRQHFCRFGQRRDRVGVGRRCFRRRMQRRFEAGGGLADRGDLRLLIGRDEAGDRLGARHLGQRGETRGRLLGRSRIGLQQFGRVGAGARVLAQFEKSRDCLRFRVLQVQRVEVEMHPVQQRRAQHDRADRRPTTAKRCRSRK